MGKENLYVVRHVRGDNAPWPKRGHSQQWRYTPKIDTATHAFDYK